MDRDKDGTLDGSEFMILFFKLQKDEAAKEELRTIQNNTRRAKGLPQFPGPSSHQHLGR